MKKFSLILILAVFSVSVFAQEQERFSEEEVPEKQEVQNQEPEAKPKPTNKAKAPAPKSDFWSRTRFGGNFGAGFSNGFSYVNVSPRMYYLATEKLWLGAGVTFIWSKDNYYVPPFDQQFVYGLNFSAQYMLFGPLFLQAEYEPLSYERYTGGVDPSSGRFVVTGEERVWINSLLLGGGISQPIGGRGLFFVSVLYNVTWTNAIDSYYGSPWVFRIGAGF